MSTAKRKPNVFDDNVAQAEGWKLHETWDHQKRKLMMEVGRFGERFTTDRHALHFVMTQARAGSKYHQEAVKHVMAFNMHRRR